MVIAFTGHRPDKLGGYTPNPTQDLVRFKIQEVLMGLGKIELAISGMALGVDQLAAKVCMVNEIPVWAAIPFDGQEKVWPRNRQEEYHTLLTKVIGKTIISQGGYASWKMQIRNEWMVNRCDLLIAVWDGSSGGTSNCIKYANEVNCPVRIINPETILSS